MTLRYIEVPLYLILFIHFSKRGGGGLAATAPPPAGALDGLNYLTQSVNGLRTPRSYGRVGENPGNEVDQKVAYPCEGKMWFAHALETIHDLKLAGH